MLPLLPREGAMSRVTLTYFTDGNDVAEFEATTVSEALALRAEYLLLTVGEGSAQENMPPPAADDAASPAPVKPSGFLSKTKGGE